MREKIERRLPLIAAVVALCLALIGLLSAFRTLTAVVFAFVPLLAGIGILRRRVWAAYGFALYLFGQVLLLPIVLRSSGGMPGRAIALTVGLNVVLIVLFAAAGRSLSSSGAKHGYPAVWIVITLLFTLPLLFVRAFLVPSGGMENTLLRGDRILVRVLPHVQPRDGEIILFRYPLDRRQIYLKRVIGKPGDRIRIASNVVYRNGVALREPYAVYKFNSAFDRMAFPGKTAPAGIKMIPGAAAALDKMLRQDVVNGEIVVPPGEYFVLGDNRDNSLDSRYWGLLDERDIVGTPLLIYDSREPVAAGGKMRWQRLFKTF